MDSSHLPEVAGLGIKPGHFQDALRRGADSLWFEVHIENYLVSGGPRLAGLVEIAERAPVSLHGVSGSLGGFDAPPAEYFAQVRRLISQVRPAAISEHAVWSRTNGRYYPDLLPLPRTHEALAQLIRGVNRFQDEIGRQILIENPAGYLEFTSDFDEPEFLVEVAHRSGCGLLVDVNNLYVTARNTGIDAFAYLDHIPPDLVGEIHIAGHSNDPLVPDLLIDSHDGIVSESVWDLLSRALDSFGRKPVLIERDGNIPPFSELMDECEFANRILDGAHPREGPDP